MTSEERFWSRVEKTDGCWLWHGQRDRLGYGKHYERASERGQRGRGFTFLAHRYSWLLRHGSIDGECVLHRCDNPPCVNPDHLFLGTRLDNVADMLAKGRGKSPPPLPPGHRPPEWFLRGEATSHAKLVADQVLEIRRRAASGEPRRALAAEYSVSLSLVTQIVLGRVWRHLLREDEHDVRHAFEMGAVA